MSRQSPTVTVVIPTYNRAHLIGRALRSVLAQTHQDFEIIIVDDGSSDDTEEVINNYPDQRITYYRHGRNRGGSVARNTGIELAKGRFIAFLDSDDEWLPRKLEKQVGISLKSESPDSIVVYTGLLYLDGRDSKTIKAEIPLRSGWLFSHLLLDNVVGGCSAVMVPRKCLDVVGTFDETLHSSQDLDLWIRLSKRFPFFAVNEVLCRVYVHEARITQDVQAKVQARERIFEKHSQEIRKNRKAHGYYHFKTAKIYCHNGFLREGRKELLRAIRIDPLVLEYYSYLTSTCFTFRMFQRFARLKSRLASVKTIPTRISIRRN